MIHPHTPSAVCSDWSYAFTDFSIYTYANAFCTKNALKSPVYCAESSLSSINKKAGDLTIVGFFVGRYPVSSASRYATRSRERPPGAQITYRCLSGSS
jgi:hypothetical protein